MKSIKKFLFCSSLLLLAPFLSSCITDTKSQEKSNPTAQESLKPQDESLTPVATTPAVGLPVKYQTPTYLVDKKAEKDPSLVEDAKMKVEARITSTRGPQPLWDIIKRLASLKGMNVSWASDVDQNVLVDVNISANDDYFAAIDNLLRQVDYFHEVQGNTIIVKYKETKQFQIAMPFIKQTFKTKTGGDVLGGGGGTGNNVAGEIVLQSEGAGINQHKDGKLGEVEFNTWSSIENNLNAILNIWSTESITSSESTKSEVQQEKNKTLDSQKPIKEKQIDSSAGSAEITATFQKSKGGNSYFIDKPVGLITVTAPRPIQERLTQYFNALKKELYKQVSIEAKILEVQLDSSSSIGLNWNLILKNLSWAGGQFIGGKSYDKSKTNSDSTTDSTSKTYDVIDTVSNGRDITNTGTSVDSRNKTYNYATGSDPTADTGSGTSGTDISDILTSSASNVVTNTLGTAATSAISAATIVSEGLSGSLGGVVSLAAFSFDSFLNAVSAQGKATILSNPKLSVMNGQPALITVGRNVTYISKITSDVSDAGVITYSAETARALSGVGLALTANILDDNQIILNLVPVTSELVEPIEYRTIGLGSIGLPIINVREMGTTIKVKNNEMLVIGGLISSVNENDGTFIPGTENFSFFKYLFGYETKLAKKRELIILLRPRII